MTNRQKNFGLQATNDTDRTPGVLAGIVKEVGGSGGSGVPVAKKYALDASKQMRDALPMDEKHQPS